MSADWSDNCGRWLIGCPETGGELSALFMNGATHRRRFTQRGRAFQDRHKQGCLCEAPMDGFTAFLKSPPPLGEPPHTASLQPFMNNARADYVSRFMNNACVGGNLND
jgi:hypothetical protein